MGQKSCEVNGKTRKFICKIQSQVHGRNITEFKIQAQYIYLNSKTQMYLEKGFIMKILK